MGAVYTYTTVDSTEDCYILVGGGAFFRYTAVHSTEDCFIKVSGGSSLHV